MSARICKTIRVFAFLLLAFGINIVAAGELPVGFTTMTVPGDTVLRGDTSGQLRVVVWYPAPAETAVRAFAVGPPSAPYFVEGTAAKDAPLASASARWPFVVVSHGTGGTNMDLAWLCAGLAARGYIVAAVDHPGNNALEAPTVAGNTVWWMRADDLSHVIDGVLAMPRFGPRVDRTRIGAAGLSLGGLTVLIIGGARTDSGLLDAYCARKADNPACSGEASPAIPGLRAKASELAASNAQYRAAVAANADSHRDSRVKAVLSIEPAEGPAMIPESLAAISIPTAFVAGIGDRIVPVIDNAIPDALAIPNAQLTLLPKPAGHYTFLIDCTPAGRKNTRRSAMTPELNALPFTTIPSSLQHHSFGEQLEPRDNLGLRQPRRTGPFQQLLIEEAPHDGVSADVYLLRW